MLIQLLFINPLLFVMAATAILFAITIHEYSHALMAYHLGDSTAKDMGRLSINPLAHLDPFGTLFLLIAGFGWGKPVPFNPNNLRNKRWGEMMVALAGPLSNFVMATGVGLILRFAEISNPSIIFFFSTFVWINIILGVFNLLPVPPLDGSHVLFSLLPASWNRLKASLFQSGFLVIVGAIFFMMYVGIPFICEPLFRIITGSSLFF